MIIPPALQKGDRIGIVSTARKMTSKELQPAIDWLWDQGFEPVLSPYLDEVNHQMAGDDKTRAIAFQTMLEDSTIQAIWCARGGYGTVRMIDAIDFSTFHNHPKWIMGYSDATILHHALYTMGIASLHSCMPIDFPDISDASKDSLVALASGRTQSWKAGKAINKGEASGNLVGGNLSIMVSLLGSVSEIKTEGCILMLEDVGEYLYHFERLLITLKRAGKLDGLAGLVFGGVSDMRDNTKQFGQKTDNPFGKSIEQIIHDVTSDLEIPIAMDTPWGHVSDNRSWIHGGEATLHVGTKVQLDQLIK